MGDLRSEYAVNNNKNIYWGKIKPVPFNYAQFLFVKQVLGYIIIKEVHYMKHKPNQLHPKDPTDFLSKHHAYPTGRMKSKDAPKTEYPSLTIRLWRKRHDIWHDVFRCKTIDEIIWELHFRPAMYEYNKDYKKLFKCKPSVASRVLTRFKRIKTRDVMNQDTGLKVAHEVQNAIKDLQHLYTTIVVRENGEREVKIRLKDSQHYS